MAAKNNYGCKIGPTKEARLRPPSKASAPCYYYQQGYCAKAAKCSFSHGSSSKIHGAASKLNDSQATQMGPLKFPHYPIQKAPAVPMVPLLHQNLHNPIPTSFKPLQLNLLPVLDTDSSHSRQQKRKKDDYLSKFKHYVHLHEEQARKVSKKAASQEQARKVSKKAASQEQARKVSKKAASQEQARKVSTKAASAVPSLRSLGGCRNIDMLKDTNFAGPKSFAEILAKKKQKLDSSAQFEAEREVEDCESVPKSFADYTLSDEELKDAAELRMLQKVVTMNFDMYNKYDDFLETILS